MKAKRIIGFVLLFGAIFALGSKFLDDALGNFDTPSVILLILFGILLLMGIGRVLRS